MIFTILFALFIFAILGMSVLIGFILLLSYYTMKERKAKRRNIAIFLIVVPVVFVLILWINSRGQKEEVVVEQKEEPSFAELSGVYHVSFATDTIDRNCVLEIRNDGSYMITPKPKIAICQQGKFYLDYNSEFEQITTSCGETTNYVHVNSNFSIYQIEMFSDGTKYSNSKDVLVFEKDEINRTK
jgi:hypothetical protein